jgi:hypothetical protein
MDAGTPLNLTTWLCGQWRVVVVMGWLAVDKQKQTLQREVHCILRECYATIFLVSSDRFGDEREGCKYRQIGMCCGTYVRPLVNGPARTQNCIHIHQGLQL